MGPLTAQSHAGPCGSPACESHACPLHNTHSIDRKTLLTHTVLLLSSPTHMAPSGQASLPPLFLPSISPVCLLCPVSSAPNSTSRHFSLPRRPQSPAENIEPPATPTLGVPAPNSSIHARGSTAVSSRLQHYGVARINETRREKKTRRPMDGEGIKGRSQSAGRRGGVSELISRQ